MDAASENAAIEKFYRWNAPLYDLTRWTILRGRRAAVEATGLRPGMSVLEIGVGTGLNLPLLQQAVGASGRVVGVDYSQAMLTRAERRRTSTTRLIRADASTLDLGESFDAVFAAYAFTIIPGWREALRRAAEHLSEPGVMVILDFGRRERPLAVFKALFDRYLALSRVDAGRDLFGELDRILPGAEALRPTDAFFTVLRGHRGGVTGRSA